MGLAQKNEWTTLVWSKQIYLIVVAQWEAK